MSPSMWAWRVVFPGLGLAASALVLYRSTRADAPTGPGIDGPPAASAPALADGDRVVAEGRIAARPGAEVAVGTDSGGLIVAFPAREKARVRRGDLLIEFRSDDLKGAVLEAEAKLGEGDAEVAFARREYERRASAPSKAAQFAAELDAARRDFEVASARRRGVVAALERARAAVGRARVLAPIDGVVVATRGAVGEVVAPLSALVTVCDLDRVRVEAEVDEYDAGRIREGDDVLIKAEGSAGDPWPGTVEEVPDRVAERTARPEDPGRPTDTRVLLVKIAPNGPIPLKLGQQVEVEIRPHRATPRPTGSGAAAGPRIGPGQPPIGR